MAYKAARRTVDLSAYPDLVVILLGMRAKSLRGHLTLLSFRGPITKAVKAQPDGLLAHEWMTMTLFPLHVGMRQYWRDFESLERWARTDARHSAKSFAEDPRGTTFWHETYLRQGGIEIVHGNPDAPGHTFNAPLLTGTAGPLLLRTDDGRRGQPGIGPAPAAPGGGADRRDADRALSAPYRRSQPAPAAQPTQVRAIGRPARRSGGMGLPHHSHMP